MEERSYITYENSRKQKDTPELISYRQLRKIIGLIGFFLPFVLYFGDTKKVQGYRPQSSISFYYHTNMGDVFVGMICAVALFLFTYKGHKKEKEDLLSDNQAGNIAAIFAFGVAFFPCAEMEGIRTTSSVTHLICASLFFSMLAYFCFKLFIKTKGEVTPYKIKRNKIYLLCGWIILLSIGMLSLYLIPIFEAKFKETLYFWFWEVVALWAFAFSWMVKGEVVFRDKKKKNKI